MKYIIMANGQGKRWNNYQGITKQEAVINGERLIDRTVRQISERTSDPIIILSRNPNHDSAMATRTTSKDENFFRRLFGYEMIDGPVTYLYGDTYYKDEAMDQIVYGLCEYITFYGSERAIIAIKVNDFKLFKSVIDNDSEPDTSVYHMFDFIKNKREFISVGDNFININTPEDYERLEESTRKRKKD